MVTDSRWEFRVEGLVTTYPSGNHVANDGISLQVRPEEVYGLLGPNSAGKSTLVKRAWGCSSQPAARSHSVTTIWRTLRQPVTSSQCLPQAQIPIDSFKARQAIEIARLNHGGETDEVRRLAMGVWDEQAHTSPEKHIWAS